MVSIVFESDRLYNMNQGGLQMHYVMTKDGGLQARWTTEETRDLATLLTTQIKGHEAEISSLKIALDTVQNQCPHDGGGVVEYRNYQLGKCWICKKSFIAKREVDEIFST